MNHCSDYFAIEQTAKVAQLPRTGEVIDSQVLYIAAIMLILLGIILVFKSRIKRS